MSRYASGPLIRQIWAEHVEYKGSFFERFAVDTGDFDFHRYFLMEGEGLLYSLFRRAILRKPHSRKREPVTLAMLYRAALDRKWDSHRLSELK